MDKIERLIERLEDVRKERDWSTEKMASEIGIARKNYSLWKNGHRRPSSEKLFKILDFLEDAGAGVVQTPVGDTPSVLVTLDGNKEFWIVNKDTSSTAYLPKEIFELKVPSKDESRN